MISKTRNIIILIFAFFLFVFTALSQNIEQAGRDSTAIDTLKKTIRLVKKPIGKEFWLCFEKNYQETDHSVSDKLWLELFITGDYDTKVHIEIKNLHFQKDVEVPGKTVVNVQISPDAELKRSDLVSKHAIHITADNPVSIYALNRRFQTTDTYLGLPVNVLGKEYRTICYSESGGLVSEFAIIATEDHTKISIVPSANTKNYPRGIEFSKTMNKGEVYQLFAKFEAFSNCDLTGTLIKANKKIAVFSGHQCAYVPHSVKACNHLVEQLPPISSWGRHFYLGKFHSRVRYTYRVLANKPDTKVFVNNKLIKTLDGGEFLERQASDNIQLTATKPILVAQYSHGFGDGDNVGDPMMILISPTQQFLNKYRFATPVNGSWNHYINVVVPTVSINSLRLDGKPLSDRQFHQIGLSRYSIGYIKIPFGTHTIYGDDAFGMYSYGFGFKGAIKNDAYDAYGTMGGQSFIEYETEKDTLPPTIELALKEDSTKLIIRDDRIYDSGISEIRVIDDYGIEAEISKIYKGMPQGYIKLAPWKKGVPGRIIVELIDMVANKSVYTLCYNIDKDLGRYTYYLSEGIGENCKVDPGFQIGVFGNFTANLNFADFSSTDGLSSPGTFKESFGFGGFAGLLISRNLAVNQIVSARIILENIPGTLSAPDSSTSFARDANTKELKIVQKETTLKLDNSYLNFSFAYEWYLRNQFYFLGGLNLNLKMSSAIKVKRQILIPEDFQFLNSGRTQDYADAPKELKSLNTLRFGIFGGIGFNYNINYRYSIFGEFILRQYLNDVVDDANWSLTQPAIHLGLRYRI